MKIFHVKYRLFIDHCYSPLTNGQTVVHYAVLRSLVDRSSLATQSPNFTLRVVHLSTFKSTNLVPEVFYRPNLFFNFQIDQSNSSRFVFFVSNPSLNFHFPFYFTIISTIFSYAASIQIYMFKKNLYCPSELVTQFKKIP